MKVNLATWWQSWDSGPVSSNAYSVPFRVITTHVDSIQAPLFLECLYRAFQQSWRWVLLPHIPWEVTHTGHSLHGKQKVFEFWKFHFKSSVFFFPITAQTFVFHTDPKGRQVKIKPKIHHFQIRILHTHGWSGGWQFHFPMTEKETQGKSPLVRNSCSPWKKYSVLV